jgi:hypothetical protein
VGAGSVALQGGWWTSATVSDGFKPEGQGAKLKRGHFMRVTCEWKGNMSGVSGGSESINVLFNVLICGSFTSFWFLQKIKIVV